LFNESKKIAGSKLERVAASHQHALVQVHFSYLDQVEKTNQTELQKGNITPTCTGVGSFLLLGLGGEHQPNRTAEMEYHTNVHWCRFISPCWTGGENQYEIRCAKRKFSYFTQRIRFHSNKNACA